MAKRTVVLDVKLPFRSRKDLESGPNEKEALLTKVRDAQNDRATRVAWARLLKDHAADEVWIQAYHQDPRHPFVHEHPHLARNLKTGSPEPETDLQEEPEQRSGKSGQLVITVHFPKGATPRSDENLAKSTEDFLTRIEADQRFQEHCRAYGYRTGNARGQEYDDLEAIKHNSISGSCDSGCGGSFSGGGSGGSATPAPTISSFSPVSGPVGTPVTLTGLNFSGATEVKFNGVSAGFSVVSDTSITATVPAGTTTGLIQVTTPGGTATSAPNNFTVIQPPTITFFSPSTGLAGTSVTILGTNFSGATEVTFNGVSASFSVVSDTSITATAPAEIGPIQVTTPGGTATSAPNNFTVIQPPTITFFSPSNGLAGTSVDILGTNFNGATAVTFNGISAGFSVAPDGASITATVPVGATTGVISVTAPGGTATSAPDNFTV